MAWLVIAAYLNVTTINPVVAAVRSAQTANEQRVMEEARITPDEHYGRSISDLQQVLSKSAQIAESPSLQKLTSLKIQRLVANLNAQRKSMDAWWTAQMDHMRSHHLAPEIIARQVKLEHVWREKDLQLQEKINAAGSAADPASRAHARDALLVFLKKELPEKRANLVDHDNLPWQVLKANARKPIENIRQLRSTLAKTRETSKSALTPKITTASLPDTHIGAKQQVSVQRVPTAPASLTAINPPTAADLTETIDAPFTTNIRQKAADLNNNPVAIFNWVHDNVKFFPSYGSTQGAQDTMDKLRGNAFDQASLLIALLRSSGIPARYVYGTVDLPINQALNWVGGVQTVNAAQQILGQGGIPNVALTSGGVVKMLRIEHVWVEAYVNYNPSRGTKATPADTWVPLDPSWKQYTFTQGMNFQSGISIDSGSLLAAAQQGATVNETEGWVQNLNQANIESQFSTYQTQVQAFVNGQNANATVGDVLGTQKIEAQNLTFLPASTPYAIQSIAQRYSELPDSLRHHFDYQLFLADAPYSDALMDWNVPTVTIAGKKITFAWVPATQADSDAIQSYLPKPHADGSPIQPSEIPTGLPASIHVKLELRVDGTKVADGGSYSLGTELTGIGGFTRYTSLSQYDLTQDRLIAGQQSALGVSIQGLSTRQLSELRDRMADTQSKLQIQAISSLTGESITGDMLTATIWSYFASLENFASVSHRTNGMIDLPGLSYGFFHSVAQPNYLYGIVITSVSFKGGNMDVGHLRNIRWVRSDQQGIQTAVKQWVAYNQMSGQYASTMENSVPEQLFVDKTKCSYVDASGNVINPTLPECVQGVSAIKALAIAEQQGQKIFTINQSNATLAIPQLQQSSSVVSEVQNAVAAGKIVTIHQSPITSYGWKGAGYIEIDPATGSGAYLIEGAGAGGFIFLAVILLIALSIFIPFLLFSGGFIGIVGLALGVAGGIGNFLTFLDGLKNAQSEADFDRLAAYVGLKAFASLLFAALGYAFYGALPELGGITALTPYTILNAALWMFAKLLL